MNDMQLRELALHLAFKQAEGGVRPRPEELVKKAMVFEKYLKGESK